MAAFKKFEEINAWKKSYEVTVAIYNLTSDGNFARDFGLRDQIRRASVSIMANIAEGHGRKSNLEFANFLNVARGSAAEVQSHLHVARGIGYIDNAEFDSLYSKVTEISRMLLSLAQYLRENDISK